MKKYKETEDIYEIFPEELVATIKDLGKFSINYHDKKIEITSGHDNCKISLKRDNIIITSSNDEMWLQIEFKNIHTIKNYKDNGWTLILKGGQEIILEVE